MEPQGTIYTMAPVLRERIGIFRLEDFGKTAQKPRIAAAARGIWAYGDLEPADPAMGRFQNGNPFPGERAFKAGEGAYLTAMINKGTGTETHSA